MSDEKTPAELDMRKSEGTLKKKKIFAICMTTLVLLISIFIGLFTYVMAIYPYISYNVSHGAPPIGLYVNISEDGTEWKVLVVSVQGIVKEYNIHISIRASNGTQLVYKLLSTYISGVPQDNVTYFDITDNDTIDAGDYFILDRDVYPAGTKFELIHVNGLSGYVTLE